MAERTRGQRTSLKAQAVAPAQGASGVQEWTPPFVAFDDANTLDCPACKEPGAVRVREKEHYFDSDTIEAYCACCHLDLEVTVCVEITFCDPERAS